MLPTLSCQLLLMLLLLLLPANFSLASSVLRVLQSRCHYCLFQFWFVITMYCRDAEEGRWD